MESHKPLTEDKKEISAEEKFESKKDEFFEGRREAFEGQGEKWGWKLIEGEKEKQIVTTSQGEELEIEHRVYNQASDPEGKKPTVHTVLMTNSEKEDVGTSYFFIRKKSGIMTRRVDVDDEYRGQGYSKPLMNFGENLLIEAKNTIENIRERVENDNFEKLVDYLQDAVNEDVPYDEGKIQSLIQEQVRWQNMFFDRYSDHDRLEIQKVEYKSIPDIIQLISKAEDTENNTIEETALARATALEGMLIDAFNGEDPKLATVIYIQPK